jgi:hypothetical protein
MKTVKFVFLVVAILAISAPAFALCGICHDTVQGPRCDGIPDNGCHHIKVQGDPGYIICDDSSGYCPGALAGAATVSEQWTVASVETNGVVTTAEEPEIRTASLDARSAAGTSAQR